MPTANESQEEILKSIERHVEKLGPEQLQDRCLNNAQEVAADSNSTDGDMVKTVPYSIAIPHSNEADEGSDRFTPVTEQTPTPVPATPAPGEQTPAPVPATSVPDTPVPGEEEILIPSRPSSAAPPQLRSAGKSFSPTELRSGLEKAETVNLLNLYTARSNQHQKPLSFKDLTAEFDRMLKPLSQQMGSYPSASVNDSYYYDTSGECSHPVLAIEPRNPATPPKSFKIHKQRTVIKPGYTYTEPVLFDLPINPDTVTNQGIENILEIAEKMRPLPPRVDNYTHYPPSRHLLKPCYYCPRPFKPATHNHTSHPSNFEPHSKCSSSSIRM